MSNGTVKRKATTGNPMKKTSSTLGSSLPGEGTQQESASGPMARASNMAHQATDTLKQAASDGAGAISRQVTGLLDRQVGSGAQMISQVASSTRMVARDMDEKMPQIAGVVRTVADRMDSYATDIKDKSVEQLLGSASDFSRRQPAVVFGLAALAGFLAFRTLGSIPSQSSAMTDSTDLNDSTDRTDSTDMTDYDTGPEQYGL